MKEKKEAFTLTANAVFFAKDIDDAFTQLEKHFKDMKEGKNGIEFFQGSRLGLEIDLTKDHL